MDKPNKAELTRFLEAFHMLDEFEAVQFGIRGHGAFNRATTVFPDPQIVKCLQWLRSLVEEKDADV